MSNKKIHYIVIKDDEEREIMEDEFEDACVWYDYDNKGRMLVHNDGLRILKDVIDVGWEEVPA